MQRSEAPPQTDEFPAPVRGLRIAARPFFTAPLPRGLDISGGDEQIGPNVTIWSIGDV